MKRQMINTEQLAFPSGIAAAETLRSLYARGKESVRKARVLIGSLVAGIGVGLLRAFEVIPEDVKLRFIRLSVPGRPITLNGAQLGMTFEPSMLLIAAGMIVGLRVSISMMVGSLTNYTVLAPYALSQDDWEEEGRTFFGHIDTAAYGLTFDVGSSTLPEASAAGAYQMLSGDEGTGRYRLVPYARETEPNPTELGVARGNAVREALIARGMSPDAIEVAEPEIIGVRDGSRRVLFLRLDPGNPDFHERPITLMIRLMRWSLWFGTALMVSAGITSFAMGWRTIARAFQGIGKGGGSGNAAMDAIEVPMKWMIIGLTPITIGLTLLCWFSFHISPWLAVVSVALSFVLAMVACRATGETDTTPIGAMGKITQFIYAVLAPADKGVNLMTAGITAGAAGSAADLLTDLKSGYLLGANPRKQFLAQFFGVFFGTLAVVPAWYALVPSKAALEGFNSPATTMWYAVAEALAAGIQSIPESARYAIVIGGLLGIVLPLVESVSPPNVRKWIPSSMGLGLAFVVPFANALSFFIGALIAFVWMKRTSRRPRSSSCRSPRASWPASRSSPRASPSRAPPPASSPATETCPGGPSTCVSDPCYRRAHHGGTISEEDPGDRRRPGCPEDGDRLLGGQRLPGALGDERGRWPRGRPARGSGSGPLRRALAPQERLRGLLRAEAGGQAEGAPSDLDERHPLGRRRSALRQGGGPRRCVPGQALLHERHALAHPAVPPRGLMRSVSEAS
jgi:hypothetical protein